MIICGLLVAVFLAAAFDSRNEESVRQQKQFEKDNGQ
jgi:hypothetical protein